MLYQLKEIMALLGYFNNWLLSNLKLSVYLLCLGEKVNHYKIYFVIQCNTVGRVVQYTYVLHPRKDRSTQYRKRSKSDVSCGSFLITLVITLVKTFLHWYAGFFKDRGSWLRPTGFKRTGFFYILYISC